LLAAAAVTLTLAAPADAKGKPPKGTTTTTTSTTSTTTSTTTTTTTTSPTTTTTLPPPGPRPTVGGNDISWPQCSRPYPAKPAFGIVGVGNGLAYSDNPCLADEYAWATRAPRAPGLYMNTANPGAQSVHWTTPGPRPCGGASDDLGCAYNYGWNAASHAYAYATSQQAIAVEWWLDVEIANTWSTNLASNNADIQGMIDFLRSQSRTVGVYSTTYQWNQITGGTQIPVPNWVAGASNSSQAVTWCTPSRSFSGGAVTLVQYPAGSFDGDVAC
jgi:hypothetical protein